MQTPASLARLVLIESSVCLLSADASHLHSNVKVHRRHCQRRWHGHAGVYGPGGNYPSAGRPLVRCRGGHGGGRAAEHGRRPRRGRVSCRVERIYIHDGAVICRAADARRRISPPHGGQYQHHSATIANSRPAVSRSFAAASVRSVCMAKNLCSEALSMGYLNGHALRLLAQNLVFRK